MFIYFSFLAASGLSFGTQGLLCVPQDRLFQHPGLLSGRGAWASLPCGMCGLSSPALEGRFLAMGPSWKSLLAPYNQWLSAQLRLYIRTTWGTHTVGTSCPQRSYLLALRGTQSWKFFKNSQRKLLDSARAENKGSSAGQESPISAVRMVAPVLGTPVTTISHQLLRNQTSSSQEGLSR